VKAYAAGVEVFHSVNRSVTCVSMEKVDAIPPMALIGDIEGSVDAVAAAAEAVGIGMFMLRSICLGLLATKDGAYARL
jgi:hypothetical protein